MAIALKSLGMLIFLFGPLGESSRVQPKVVGVLQSSEQKPAWLKERVPYTLLKPKHYLANKMSKKDWIKDKLGVDNDFEDCKLEFPSATSHQTCADQVAKEDTCSDTFYFSTNVQHQLSKSTDHDASSCFCELQGQQCEQADATDAYLSSIYFVTEWPKDEETNKLAAAALHKISAAEATNPELFKQTVADYEKLVALVEGGNYEKAIKWLKGTIAEMEDVNRQLEDMPKDEETQKLITPDAEADAKASAAATKIQAAWRAKKVRDELKEIASFKLTVSQRKESVALVEGKKFAGAIEWLKSIEGWYNGEEKGGTRETWD